MSKIVSLTILKGIPTSLDDLITARVTLFNVSRLRDLEQKTLTVNGVANAGCRFNYDEGEHLGYAKSYFVDENKSVIKTAIEILGATNVEVFDVTVVPETGANYTKSIKVADFLFAYDHPTAAGDSRLVILSADHRSTETYRIDQTRAALLTLVNA